MGKGPGLYSDIGKKARGALQPSYYLLDYACFGLLTARVYSLNFFIFSRSSLQGLPGRPKSHSYYLHFHRSCEYFSVYFIFLILMAFNDVFDWYTNV